MNIDAYRRMQDREVVLPEVDARILGTLQETQRNRTYARSNKTFGNFRLQRVVALASLFVFLSFATITATSKILNDEWFGLFRSLETQETELNTQEWSTRYKQEIGQSVTQNGLTMTLENIYFDGKILFTESVLHSADGGAIFKDPELSAKYQNSENFEFQPSIEFTPNPKLNEYAYMSQSTRLDDGSDPNTMRFLNYSALIGELGPIDELSIAMDGLAFYTEGKRNIDEAPYFVFGDPDWHAKPAKVAYTIRLKDRPEPVQLKPKEGLSISYTDLSLSLIYETERTKMPDWYLAARDVPKSNAPIFGVVSSMDLEIKVNYSDGQNRIFQTKSNYSERIVNHDLFGNGSDSGETQLPLATTGNNSDPNESGSEVVALPDTATPLNQSYLSITIPFMEVLNSAEIESFEIGGELIKVK